MHQKKLRQLTWNHLLEMKQFFVWVDVTGMEVDLPASDYIYFKVGIISKKIEIFWFETVPTCKDKIGKEPCNEAKFEVSLVLLSPSKVSVCLFASFGSFIIH